MATQAEICQLIKELKVYKLKGTTDTQEKLTRRNLYLQLFILVFPPKDTAQSKQDFTEACNFVNNIYHHANLRKVNLHLILAEGFDNELKRRKSLPQQGIKFPEFLHKKYVIDTLIKYCNYLMKGDEEVDNYLKEHCPGAFKAACDAANKELAHDLSKVFMINYSK